MERTFDVEIKGMSPLLMNAMRADALEAKNEPGGTKVNDPKKCLYETPGGVLYVPATAIYSGLVHAGGDFQVKGKGKKTYRQLIAGAVSIEPSEIPITPQKWTVDERAVVLQTVASKPRVLRRRPRFDDWSLNFKLRVSEESLPEQVVHEALSQVGRLIGILDFRPAKKGPFGRFLVTKLQEVENEEDGKH